MGSRRGLQRSAGSRVTPAMTNRNSRLNSNAAMLTKTLIVFIVVAALGGTSAGLWFHFTKPQKEMTLPGTVESQEVRLSSRVGGRVAKVHVVDGQLLEAGQPIVELEVPEL